MKGGGGWTLLYLLMLVPIGLLFVTLVALAKTVQRLNRLEGELSERYAAMIRDIYIRLDALEGENTREKRT